MRDALRKRLQKLAQGTDEKFLFDILANDYQRRYKYTELDSLIARTKERRAVVLDRKKVITFFKQLESLGLGELRLQTPPATTTFYWDEKEVGNAWDIVANAALGRDTPSLKDTVVRSRAGVGLPIHFPWHGGVLTFDLPKDMTKHEFVELGEFIKKFGRT
jgi:hypothetical protein